MNGHDYEAREYVLQAAQDADVKFIRLWFPDILGNLKGFAINVDDLNDAIQQGVGFDGAAIEGFARTDESDMRAFPDPNTFTLLPWRPQRNAVARMFCDIRLPRGRGLRRRPPRRPQAQPGAAGPPRLYLLRRHRVGVFLPEKQRQPGTP